MKMRKIRSALVALITLFLITVLSMPAFAAELLQYTNEETGFEAVIYDEAKLLTDQERQSLLEQMKPITAYGNAGFVTTDKNAYESTKAYAQDYYYERFANESGVLLLIDMDNRRLWICSDGFIYTAVTDDKANVITDNIYTYASDAEFDACAQKAFEQILRVIEGQRIAQPMKYIGNAFLALLFSLLLMFVVVTRLTGIKKASDTELLSAAAIGISVAAPVITKTGSHKTRIPTDNGGGSGGGHIGGGGFSGGGFSGGGGGSSSGGGGGGFSGGGGGHKF